MINGKNIKRTLVAILVATGSYLFSQSTQDKNDKIINGTGPGYKTGIGFRLGYEGGVTVKHFLGNNAIEGILSRGWGYGGFRITGLYEIQKNIPSVTGLDWFFGFGAHIGFYNGNYYGYSPYGDGYYDKHGNWHPSGYRSRYMTLGVDGIIGLEYIFQELPLTLSIDIKPYFDIIGYGDRFADGALSIRYAIK